MDFPQELLLPQRTIFRKGAAVSLAEETLSFGPRGLVIHGRSLNSRSRLQKILRAFPADAKVAVSQRGTGEPSLGEIRETLKWAKKIDACWIAGIGGGSVLDLAKAAAGLYNSGEDASYYQAGGKLEKMGIPFIAVPTTAGTGSEATPNSVIINCEKKAKLSIRDKSFMARTVILDAELLKDPRDVLSYSAMDALVQAYESFTSKNATWFSETLALKAVRLINDNILPAYGGDEERLSGLLLGSYLCGIALASSRLGVIHGLAHPLGALYGAPHGLICSLLFTPSIRMNREAIGEKYDTLSSAVGSDLEQRVRELLDELGIRSPFKGKKLIEKDKMIAETLSSGSTAANPRTITAADVEKMLGDVF